MLQKERVPMELYYFMIDTKQTNNSVVCKKLNKHFWIYKKKSRAAS